MKILPLICVVNTNKKILNKCQELFDEIGCANHKIYRKPNSKNKSFKNRKPCHQIRIDGFKSVLTTLKTIEPYLVAKKKQAELVREFVKSRKENLIEQDKQGHITQIHYTQKEYDTLCRVKGLNQGKSPETIRLDLQRVGKILP